MRLLIQRVSEAEVTIDGIASGKIKKGLLVFVGIEDADDEQDINWLTHKLLNLRVFDDANKIPNLSILDINGELLIVSQFTLHASVKKGNRPSYIRASKPDVAIPLYEKFLASVRAALGKEIETGVFGADMQVSLINDGPVTIWMDSKEK